MAQDANLLFVGTGPTNLAAAFQAYNCPDTEVAVDPQRETFRAFELRRGLWASLGLPALRRLFTALREGHRAQGVQGDPWQQGGTFVVDTAGRIAFRHQSRHAGDHTDPDEVIAALQGLTARRAADD